MSGSPNHGDMRMLSLLKAGSLEGAAGVSEDDLEAHMRSLQRRDTKRGAASSSAGDASLRSAMQQNGLDFQTADEDGNGRLNFSEFGSFMNRVTGTFWAESQLHEWFDTLDADSDGSISLEEFFYVSLRDAQRYGTADDTHAVFARYDLTGDGKLNEREFTRACNDLGFVENASHLFKQFDVDGSGTVNYHEIISQVKPRTASPSAKSFLLALLYRPREEEDDIAARESADHMAGLSADGAPLAAPPQTAMRATGEAGPNRLSVQLLGLLKRSDSRLVDLFGAIDQANDNYISERDLVKAVERLGYDGPVWQVHELFDTLDADGSGRISLAEFRSWVQRTPIDEVVARTTNSAAPTAVASTDEEHLAGAPDTQGATDAADTTDAAPSARCGHTGGAKSATELGVGRINYLTRHLGRKDVVAAFVDGGDVDDPSPGSAHGREPNSAARNASTAHGARAAPRLPSQQRGQTTRKPAPTSACPFTKVNPTGFGFAHNGMALDTLTRPAPRARYLDFLNLKQASVPDPAVIAALTPQLHKMLRDSAAGFHSVDADGDGQLDAGEFVSLVHTQLSTPMAVAHMPPPSEEQIRAWFDALDADGDGTVTIGEFFAFALGPKITPPNPMILTTRPASTRLDPPRPTLPSKTGLFSPQEAHVSPCCHLRVADESVSRSGLGELRVGLEVILRRSAPSGERRSLSPSQVSVRCEEFERVARRLGFGAAGREILSRVPSHARRAAKPAADASASSAPPVSMRALIDVIGEMRRARGSAATTSRRDFQRTFTTSKRLAAARTSQAGPSPGSRPYTPSAWSCSGSGHGRIKQPPTCAIADGTATASVEVHAYEGLQVAPAPAERPSADFAAYAASIAAGVGAGEVDAPAGDPARSCGASTSETAGEVAQLKAWLHVHGSDPRELFEVADGDALPIGGSYRFSPTELLRAVRDRGARWVSSGAVLALFDELEWDLEYKVSFAELLECVAIGDGGGDGGGGGGGARGPPRAPSAHSAARDGSARCGSRRGPYPRSLEGGASGATLAHKPSRMEPSPPVSPAGGPSPSQDIRRRLLASYDSRYVDHDAVDDGSAGWHAKKAPACTAGSNKLVAATPSTAPSATSVPSRGGARTPRAAGDTPTGAPPPQRPPPQRPPPQLHGRLRTGVQNPFVRPSHRTPPTYARPKDERGFAGSTIGRPDDDVADGLLDANASVRPAPVHGDEAGLRQRRAASARHRERAPVAWAAELGPDSVRGGASSPARGPALAIQQQHQQQQQQQQYSRMMHAYSQGTHNGHRRMGQPAFAWRPLDRGAAERPMRDRGAYALGRGGKPPHMRPPPSPHAFL